MRDHSVWQCTGLEVQLARYLRLARDLHHLTYAIVEELDLKQRMAPLAREILLGWRLHGRKWFVI